MGLEIVRNIFRWDAIGQDIVNGLQVEGFLDFTVWREHEMQENKQWQQQAQCKI